MKSTLAAFLCAAALVAAVAGASGTSGDLVYTRPGQLVDIGGRHINMYCIGSGAPTVVFDAGWED